MNEASYQKKTWKKRVTKKASFRGSPDIVSKKKKAYRHGGISEMFYGHVLHKFEEGDGTLQGGCKLGQANDYPTTFGSHSKPALKKKKPKVIKPFANRSWI
jgi:hypothetical protein